MWPTLVSLCLALSNLAPRKGRSGRRPAFRRPLLEELEDRTVLSGASLASYGQLPLSFEVNRGQTAAQVNYLARGSGYALFLSPTQATLGLTHGTGTKGQPANEDVVSLGLVGADPTASVSGLNKLSGVSNYFIGNDPSKWLSDVPNYGAVEYQNVYPGINLVYYGNQGQLEYDFVLAPGADPNAIRLSVQGSRGVGLDAQGNLVLHTTGGDMVEHAPVVYQDVGGSRQSVAGQFVLEGGQVGFQLGAYDPHAPLVIDPVLVYSTYLGGNGLNQADGIAVDSAGDAYVTGYTSSTNFPTTPGAVQTTNHGTGPSAENVFISKLNASGTALVYSTYLGGSSNFDGGYAIAVDSVGDAYVTGQANSTDFPTTPGAFETTAPSGGAFVTKLNPTGTALLYSTYLRDGQDMGIAVDGAGNAYVTGVTYATDFPTTAGAFQPATSVGQSAFVTKLNAAGSGLVYSTYLVGSNISSWGNGIAVDAAGSAYVTGGGVVPTTPGAFQPASSGGVYVTKLNADGSGLVYSTFLGGGEGRGIALDGAGDAFVTGSTGYASFPRVHPLQGYGGAGDAFVSELNASGSALAFSTFLGGSSRDDGLGIALDSSGNIYVTGDTTSTNFPTTPGAYQRMPSSANWQAFVAKISPAPSPSFAVAGFPASTTAGVSHTFTVTALNADGTVNTNYTGTVHFTSNDPQAVLPADYTFTAADQGVAPFTVTLKTAGSQSITATDTATGSIAGSESGILVVAAAATHFSISGPSSVRSGTSFSLTVTALDAYGNSTSYAGTVHFSDSVSGATLPRNYTFTATDAGVHSFTGLKLNTKGKQTLTVTDTLHTSIVGMWAISVS